VRDRSAGLCTADHVTAFRSARRVQLLFVSYASPHTRPRPLSLLHDRHISLNGQGSLPRRVPNLTAERSRIAQPPWITSQPRAAWKTTLLHVADVAQGPSQVGLCFGPHLYLERLLMYMGSFRSLFVRFFTSFGFRASSLHSTVTSFYLRSLIMDVAVPTHPRRPRARCRALSYNSVKFPVFRTPLHPLNIAVRVCCRQDRFDIRPVVFLPSSSSCA